MQTEKIVTKLFLTSGLKVLRTVTISSRLSQKSYCTSVRNTTKKEKHPHPYRKIHPWKSLKEFSKSLVAGVIHNEDGLVAINKPYGIPGNKKKFENSGDKKPPPSNIVKEAKYSLSDAIPYIAQELGYPELKLIKTPERFTSGVTILAANEKIENAVDKSLRYAQAIKIVPKMFWAITTRVPIERQGEKRLAMKMTPSPSGKSQLVILSQKLLFLRSVRGAFDEPVIVSSWGQNEQKRREVKILNVQFKVISNSRDNLSSLIEIKSSTKKWHALRLFAATEIYSPILGDNLYGSRVQNVMGKLMNISPFVEAAQLPPKLNKDLLQILRISPGQESMIPTHLHLRQIYLPMYGKKDRNLTLTAAPMPHFIWTGQQLKFKHELFEIDEEDSTHTEEDTNSLRHEAVV